MARLILLNGPPGIGKSTIARRFAHDHPLVLVLDVDVVRSLLGRWADDVRAAGPAARELALAMARVHLIAGHDVVVPQYLGRPAFAEQLAAVATSTRSGWTEIVLDTDVADGEARFARRGDVAQLAGSAETYADMHARVQQITRAVVRVHAVDGDIEGTYAAVLAAIE